MKGREGGIAMKEEEFQALVLNQFSKMDEKLDTIEASQLRMENKFDEKIDDATRQKLYWFKKKGCQIDGLFLWDDGQVYRNIFGEK